MNTTGKRICFMALMLILWTFCVSASAIAPLVGAALVSGGSALLGGALQMWGNYSGMKAQERENRRAEAIGMAEHAEDIARSEKWATKKFEAEKKQQKFNNAITARGLMIDMLAGNSQMANNMINIWRGRKLS